MMQAMYKLIGQLLCDYSDIPIVQTHLEHVRNTVLTEVNVIIQDSDSAKV